MASKAPDAVVFRRFQEGVAVESSAGYLLQGSPPIVDGERRWTRGGGEGKTCSLFNLLSEEAVPPAPITWAAIKDQVTLARWGKAVNILTCPHHRGQTA